MKNIIELSQTQYDKCSNGKPLYLHLNNNDNNSIKVELLNKDYIITVYDDEFTHQVYMLDVNEVDNPSQLSNIINRIISEEDIIL